MVSKAFNIFNYLPLMTIVSFSNTCIVCEANETQYVVKRKGGVILYHFTAAARLRV